MMIMKTTFMRTNGTVLMNIDRFYTLTRNPLIFTNFM